MDYVIDLIIAAIILIVIVLSAKRGFVRIVIETVGFVLALLISFTIHTPLANLTYDKMIMPAIEEAVADTKDGTQEEMTDRVWEKLPSFVKDNSFSPGVSKEAVGKAVEKSFSAGEKTAADLSETLIRPTAVQVLSLLYAMALMFVLMLIVRLLAAVVNRAVSFRLVGRINTVLGGLIGIVRGAVAAILFCLILSLLLSFNKDGIWIFTPEALEHSFFWQCFRAVT